MSASEARWGPETCFGNSTQFWRTFALASRAEQYLQRSRKVRSLCEGDDTLSSVLAKVRKDAKKLSNPISVDLTSRCNLFCEGCYYYEGDAQAMSDEEDIAKWRAFFRTEAERNAKFIYVGGAEAALYPDRIRAAAESVPFGIIAANGTIRIPRDIPYRIAVSVWGSPEDTARLRGGGTFGKALRNYATDPRAVFVYTINSQNMHQISEVARIMQSEGAMMTFNMYSPTESYLTKIQNGSANDTSFFRLSSQEDNLAFSSEDLVTCRHVVDDVIAEFPDTIVYPKAFNLEVTQDGPLFELDAETGYATNCAGRHNGTHKTILSTLKESTNKCCIPNIDCAQCRLLATVLPSRLMPKDKDVQSVESVRDWLNICQYWAWFFLNEPCNEIPQPTASGAPTLRPHVTAGDKLVGA
ncbi:hypothetical protein [Jiella pelagia]|uniref:Radical SAM protein n=1 Tax=Jiella pelagia TaxID=2986949 RepID=A0ABY7C3H5_9HYPH|nr:hypothetical protein [Jiella pelagia]WAP70286.1 hypothetical protein OH818_09425 [Jiella pelagia]